MKKYIIYIGILIVGLILGSVVFGTSEKINDDHNHETETVETQLWTCSMHPQIMKNEPGDCPICGMDLIPAEKTAEGLAKNEFKMSANALALANIETTIVSVNSNNFGSIVLSGKIKENEKTNAVQTAHFGGRIEKLLVNTTGETVRKGQQLALIYSPELVTTQKELLTALQTKDSDPTLYNAVRNKLKLWKLSENQIITIENSKNIITNFPIYANVSGVVTKKMVEEGNYVKEGQGLFMIANLTTVWADFDAYEKQLPRIKKGAKISITTNANPTKKINATTSFIDPILNTSTRTVIVRAELKNNKNDDLKPGMFVEGILSLAEDNAETKSEISVPKTAVLWTGKRSVVYVRKPGVEPIFEMREVTLGDEINGSYEILEGLNLNEEIVTNGTFTVDAAAQLQGKKSMMSPEGGRVVTGHEGMNMDGDTGNSNSTEEMSDEEMKNMDSDKTSETKKEQRIVVSKEFQNQLLEVFKGYTNLKDALTNDDSNVAQKAAKEISVAIKNVDMSLLPSAEAHTQWMVAEKEISSSAKLITETSNIEKQRNYFINLSKNVITAVKLFGINKIVYEQFCPMANDNKGAFWLSLNEQIKNPYFGSAMIKCGDTQTIIE
jgi:Cu(I)/Ag(I) efflux system membrane fusion protein